MFTSLNLSRRGLLCPHLIQSIKLPLNFTALVKPKLKAFIFTSHLHLQPFDLLFVLCVWPELNIKIPSYHSFFLLASPVLRSHLGFAEQPHWESLWTAPSWGGTLHTLKKNQDQAGTSLEGPQKSIWFSWDANGFLGCFSYKAVQNWNFSLLHPLLLFPFFF